MKSTTWYGSGFFPGLTGMPKSGASARSRSSGRGCPPLNVRIADVSVFSREFPVEQVFTRPELIAIEVLSPEDRHSRMDKKIRNYLDFGVRHFAEFDEAEHG